MGAVKMRAAPRFILVYTIIACVSGYSSEHDIADLCEEKCTEVSGQLAQPDSLRCNTSCWHEQCVSGCSLWRGGRWRPCLEECNRTTASNFQVQPCVAGCSAAVDIYAQQIEAEIGTLPAPRLAAGSQRNTSLMLIWDAPTLPEAEFVVQLRSDMLGEDWHQAASQKGSPPRFRIHQLHPYVAYQFRIVAAFTKTHSVISAASVSIPTLPYGAPSSAPVISSIACDDHSIRIRWDPPRLINGPLLGYRITVLPPTGGGHEILEDIRTSELKSMSEVVNLLHPSTDYIVRLSARNRYGLGPEVERNITTAIEDTEAAQTAYLIFGADKMVYKQDINEITDLPDMLQPSASPSNRIMGGQVLFHNKDNMSIEGVAIHYRKNLVFFTDTSKRVYQLAANDSEQYRPIYNSSTIPSALDVDWLHDRIFIAEDTQVTSCNLNGGECRAVITDMHDRAEDLHVDPCNGYLYWSQTGEEPGLYRTNMAMLPASMDDPSSYLLLINDLIMAFTLGYTDYRIYVPDESRNTMKSYNLDGTNPTDIRPHVQNPDFLEISSMVLYDHRFFWTNGADMMFEEYDNSMGQLYHNEMLFFENYFTGLNVWHPLAQPWPVPALPPGDLQVLLSVTSVRISWEAPAWGEGDSAWKDWDYEIEINNEDIHTVQVIPGLKDTVWQQDDLEPDMTYSVRVRACSLGGSGPWTQEVRGHTLQKYTETPEVVFVNDTIIFRTDLSGMILETVLTLSQVTQRVKDLVVDNERFMWSTHEGAVFMLRSGGSLQQLSHIQEASALAYEPLAQMLYWANPKHNMILRSDLNGGAPELVFQGWLAAQALALDSYEGFLYWVTQHTVEATRLNGDHHRVLHTLPYFSGKYVLGLSVARDCGRLYWLVKDANVTLLYYTSLLRGDAPTLAPVERLHQLPLPPRGIGLLYFSSRLFWLANGGLLMLSTTRGHSYAKVELPSSGTLATFALSHQSSILTESNLTTQSVIPDAVNPDLITVTGVWDNFTIAWPTTTVEHGEVFYEILLQHGGAEERIEIRESHLVLTTLSPYSHVHMAMRTCTVWKCSARTEHNFRSPMAAPSVPRELRAFVAHLRLPLSSTYSVKLELHWSYPEHPNGQISRYRLYISTNPSGPFAAHDILPPKMTFKVMNAEPNQQYYCSVDACTSVGCSARSDIVIADTNVENPVPMLITANTSTIGWFYPDIHRSRFFAQGQVVALTFVVQESTFYWLDRSNHIVRMDANDIREILSVNGTASSITVDWIGRGLYWSEQAATGQYAIRTYDLNKNNGHSHALLQRQAPIGQVAVNPYRSNLFWCEVEASGDGRMMTSRMDGSDTSAMFPNSGMQTNSARRRRASDDCNCPELIVEPVFAIDHSLGRNAEMYLVDKASSNIWASDMEGCHCRLVVNATGKNSLGLPPDSLAVDHRRIYWSNREEGVLISVDKEDGGNLVRESLADIEEILAYGQHLQPLPAPSCLAPTDYNQRAMFSSHTTQSLTLELIPWQPDSECEDISLPSVNYTVHYRTYMEELDVRGCQDTDVTCESVSSFDHLVTISGLQPYQEYLVQVSASNYHTESLPSAPVHMGPVAFFRTKEGVPSPAFNVTAQTQTPESVKVQWKRPLQPNGAPQDIRYVVEWSTSNPDSTTTSNGRIQVPVTRQDNEVEPHYYSILVDSLDTEKTYYFKVLAYDKYESGHSTSQEVHATTYQYPGPIWLEGCDQNWLTVAWQAPSDDSIAKNEFLYAKVSSELHWQPNLTQRAYSTENSTIYNQTFYNLAPNTEYAFRVSVVYKSNETFLWPIDIKYKFKTAADVPSAPSMPVLQQTTEGVDVVVWYEPPDGGSPILYYTLTARDVTTANWTVVYNGTDTRWIVSELNVGSSYLFQVAAINAMGVSPMSGNSSLLLYDLSWKEATMAPDHGHLTVALMASFGVLLLLVLGTGIILCAVCRRNKENKAVPIDFVKQVTPPTDVELATLRDLPNSTTQEMNALYAINIIPTDEDVAALPHFRRSELQLTQFLGSGAFGEVFKGTATNILSPTSGTSKVAVKTLRKGASDSTKEEFLKEALLMSNFRHEHIIRLLGVCLDHHPHFIILELMEGGDLLSFLRASRPTHGNPAQLSLPDMVNICCDVAHGCKYLEDMHFVHRDLAARNCLVSSTDPAERIVKIGDFGLARDIYKNDYYRKEGEGLLPVRWMSPESLVDGVFTTQSDVWAFGVLMWEVLTLGQQPYPARTNIEVLQYVRSGGRLDRPHNCPNDMYSLMVKCWSYVADDRPSFYFLLGQLEDFHERSLDDTSPFSGQVTPHHYADSPYPDEMSGVSSAEPLLKGYGHTNRHYMPMAVNHRGPASRIRSFFGYNDERPVSQHEPAWPSSSISKALSCTTPLSGSPSRQSSEDGYLCPKASPGKPKYLELLSKNEADARQVQGAEEPSTPRHLRASAPALSSRRSPARTLNYAQLGGQRDSYGGDNSGEACGGSVLDSPPDSPPPNPRRGRLLSNDGKAHPRYSKVPTSEHETENAASSKPPNGYAHNRCRENSLRTDSDSPYLTPISRTSNNGPPQSPAADSPYLNPITRTQNSGPTQSPAAGEQSKVQSNGQRPKGQGRKQSTSDSCQQGSRKLSGRKSSRDSTGDRLSRDTAGENKQSVELKDSKSPSTSATNGSTLSKLANLGKLHESNC